MTLDVNFVIWTIQMTDTVILNTDSDNQILSTYQFWNLSLQLPCWANKHWSACLSSHFHLHFFVACPFLSIAEIRALFFQWQRGSHCFVTSLSDDLRWSEQEVGAKWQHTGAIQGSDLPPHCQQHIQGGGAQTSRSWGWSTVFLNYFFIVSRTSNN